MKSNNQIAMAQNKLLTKKTQLDINPLERIAKGAGISLVGLVFAKALNYIYKFIVSRTGAEAYGTFSLAMAIFSFLSMFAVLGLSSGIVRYIAMFSAKKELKNISGTILSSLRITGTSSAIIAIMLFLSADYLANIFHAPNLALALRIFAIALPFDAITQIFYSALIGFKRIRYYTYSLQIIAPTTKVVLAVLLIFLGYRLYAIVGSTILSIMITFIITAYFLEAKVHSFLKNWNRAPSFEIGLLKYSLPLALSGFVFALMSWTDTIILGYFKDIVSVGIYNVAVPTAQLLYIIPSAFSTLFAPILTEAYRLGDKRNMQRIYSAVTRWNVYFNVPLLFIMVLFSPSIISLFFGTEYVSGYVAAGILSFAVITNSITVPATWVLITLGKTKTLLCITLASAIANIILNILLIPKFGLEGAAFATLVSSVFLCILTVWIAWKHSGLNPFSKSMVKPVMSAALAIYLIYAISNYIPSRSAAALAAFSAVYFAAYATTMFVLNAVEKEDKELIGNFKRKLF